MKIRITKCSKVDYWYNTCINKVFNVVWKDTHYWVRDTEGYLNLVEFQDADQVSGDLAVKVLKCSNPLLWYNTEKDSIFEVTKETLTAYWVKLKQTNNHSVDWIYKKDCEVV